MRFSWPEVGIKSMASKLKVRDVVGDYLLYREGLLDEAGVEELKRIRACSREKSNRIRTYLEIQFQLENHLLPFFAIED